MPPTHTSCSPNWPLHAIIPINYIACSRPRWASTRRLPFQLAPSASPFISFAVIGAPTITLGWWGEDREVWSIREGEHPSQGLFFPSPRCLYMNELDCPSGSDERRACATVLIRVSKGMIWAWWMEELCSRSWGWRNVRFLCCLFEFWERNLTIVPILWFEACLTMNQFLFALHSLLKCLGTKSSSLTRFTFETPYQERKIIQPYLKRHIGMTIKSFDGGI